MKKLLLAYNLVLVSAVSTFAAENPWVGTGNSILQRAIIQVIESLTQGWKAAYTTSCPAMMASTLGWTERNRRLLAT